MYIRTKHAPGWAHRAVRRWVRFVFSKDLRERLRAVFVDRLAHVYLITAERLRPPELGPPDRAAHGLSVAQNGPDRQQTQAGHSARKAAAFDARRIFDGDTEHLKPTADTR